MKKSIIKIIAFITILFAILSLLILAFKDNSDLNKVHGNVDIRQSALSFERQGIILNLLVDEGNKVKKGDLLAQLDTRDLNYQIQIKTNVCNAFEAKYNEALNGYRKEEIEQAKEKVTSLQNQFLLSKNTYERLETLFKKKAVSEQDRDEGLYNMRNLKAQLESATSAYNMMKEGYRKEEIEYLKSQFDGCNNELSYLLYQKDEQSVIKAPFSGFIRNRLKEIGSFASPNSPVFYLSYTDIKRVRAYVTEEQLVNIKLNQKVTVVNYAKNKLKGSINYISDKAMFTPKTVQTEDLRGALVYEIRVDVEDKDEYLRQGQAVTILLKDDTSN